MSVIISPPDRLKLSAVGDVLGTVVSSPLAPVITLPLGCGEQVAAAMVPLITAIDTLKVNITLR